MKRLAKCNRIMVKEDEAVAPRSQKAWGIIPAIAFVRDDGWTLAAPVGLIKAAYRQWPRDWKWVAFAPEFTFFPISEYDPETGWYKIKEDETHGD